MNSNISAISRTNSSHLHNSLNPIIYSSKYAEPRGQESWGYLDSHGHDMGAYGKSEYYWLIPLVIVIGFGALLLPLLGTLMTTMITTGTINLTAGRKRRDTDSLQSGNLSEYAMDMLAKVEKALDKFDRQIKSDVSPLMAKLGEKHF